MVAVEVVNAYPRRRVRSSDIAAYVKRVLRYRRVANARIGVVFVNSRYLRAINKRFLRHDYVTDVISFTLEEVPVLEGEIYVNLDRARSQSREYGVSVANEVARLVIHGTLHMVGFDDRTKAHRARMKCEEDRHLLFWFDRSLENKK